MKRIKTVNPTETITIDYIGNSPPDNPQRGMIQFDTNSSPAKIKFFNGIEQEEAGGGIFPLLYMYYPNGII